MSINKIKISRDYNKKKKEKEKIERKSNKNFTNGYNRCFRALHGICIGNFLNNTALELPINE